MFSLRSSAWPAFGLALGGKLLSATPRYESNQEGRSNAAAAAAEKTTRSAPPSPRIVPHGAHIRFAATRRPHNSCVLSDSSQRKPAGHYTNGRRKWKP
jgi:hypothetical protein